MASKIKTAASNFGTAKTHSKEYRDRKQAEGLVNLAAGLDEHLTRLERMVGEILRKLTKN